jgi:ligand-binding sensor domain-containing protein
MISLYRITSLVVSLAFVLLGLSSSAQIINFVQYGVENGLPQSQVNSIIQSNDGRLWIGTVSGLSAYDGIDFKNYFKKDSLSEDRITASYVDKSGTLWFGHWGGSITKYEKETQQFKSIHVEKFSSYQEVSSIIEDTVKNLILFATKGSGLFIYDLKSQKVKRYDVSEKQEASRFITTLYLDSARNLWVGTEAKGFFVVSLDELITKTPIATNIQKDQGLSGNHITAITEYQDEIWVGTKEGISYWKKSDNAALAAGKPAKITVLNQNSELASNLITCFVADNHGELWIGTSDDGLRVCVKDGNSYRFKHFSVEQGLSFYNVKSLYKDRENTIWIGTDVGLNQYISDYFVLYDEGIGLTNNIIWSLSPDKEGNIWLGTNRGVSQLINADNINNDSIQVGSYDIKGFSDIPIMSVYQDSDDNIWFGTGGGLLFKRTIKGSYEKINIEAHIQDVIMSICEDDNNNIWLGTRSGVARINKMTNKMTVFTEEDGLGGNSITKIVKDKKGTLWFAVLGGSLTSYDGKEFRVYDEKDGINHKVVISLTLDNNDELWIGCYTGGLYHFNGQKFINYNASNGMKSETPYAIVADRDNNIWFGTTYGIEKFDRQLNEFTHYGKSEGFLGVEVNPNSAAIDKNGNLWFGTILGAVKYNPNVDYYNQVLPKIELANDVLIDHKPAAYPFDGVFSSEDNNITFQFRGVSLNNPKKVKYSYRLVNHKKSEWISTDERYSAYTNLKPKAYTFEVKAVNADKVESPVASYSFEIQVPFYDRFWFYAIQILAIGIMLSLAVFYGRKTGGSRTATVLATIAIIIVFEYGINFVEDYFEGRIGNIAFIKVGLNALLGLILFPVEEIIKKRIIHGKSGPSN